MRILAIDVGQRRIGVAAGDDRTRVAVPITTIEAGPDPAADIARLLEQHAGEKLIVGLPISLNGTLGPQGRRIKAFAEALAARLPIPVETWDERLTTVEAQRRLGHGHKRRERDALAAAIILQAYLDSSPEASPPE